MVFNEERTPSGSGHEDDVRRPCIFVIAVNPVIVTVGLPTSKGPGKYVGHGIDHRENKLFRSAAVWVAVLLGQG